MSFLLYQIRMHRLWVVAVLVAIVLVVAGIVAKTTFMDDAAADDSETEREVTKHETISFSWAEGYQTLGEMADAADVVVHGTVSGIVGTRHAGVIVTRYAVDVAEAPIVREGDEHPGQVIVHQSGGVEDGTMFEAEGFPLLRTGEEVVLFLKAIPDGEYAGEFRILAGPEGRFTVEDGMVVMRSEVTPLQDYDEPMPTDAFLEEIQGGSVS